MRLLLNSYLFFLEMYLYSFAKITASEANILHHHISKRISGCYRTPRNVNKTARLAFPGILYPIPSLLSRSVHVHAVFVFFNIQIPSNFSFS